MVDKKKKKAKQQIANANANVNINIRDFTKRRSPVRKSHYGGFSQTMSQFRNITPESNAILFDKMKAKQSQALNNFSRELMTEIQNKNIDILTQQNLNKINIDTLTNENQQLKQNIVQLQSKNDEANSSINRLNRRYTNKTINDKVKLMFSQIISPNDIDVNVLKNTLEQTFRDEDE